MPVGRDEKKKKILTLPVHVRIVIIKLPIAPIISIVKIVSRTGVIIIFIIKNASKVVLLSSRHDKNAKRTEWRKKGRAECR